MLTTYDQVRPGADLELRADAVVVGSGAGGAPFAAVLAEAGWDVALLEEGSFVRTEDFDGDATRALRMLYRDSGASFVIGRPPILIAEGRCVGGSTVINGGMSWPTPPRILEDWSRRGITKIGPKDMEPYFARAEHDMSVATQSPESIGRDTVLLATGARKLGWKVLDNRRNQKHCVGSNNCAFGCPTGAKRSTLVSYVPMAERAGARVYANFRVDRVLMRGKRAIGVAGRVVDHFGRKKARFRLLARATVIAGGAMQTPALLLRSGLKSPSGQLGRNLKLHPNIKAIALFDQQVRGWHGVHQAHQIREFQDEGLVMAVGNVPPGIVAAAIEGSGARVKRVLDRYDNLVTAGVLVEDEGAGRVVAGPGGRPIATYDLTARDGEKMRRGVSLLAQALFAAGAKKVIVPLPGVPDLDGPDDLKKIWNTPFDRRRLEVFTVHLMGTCGMGSDPNRSVTSDWGAFHDAAGLYVSDASLFPGPIGVNPMETIVALALRNAQHLVETERRTS
ncbi:MAG: GMC family oxidoreductase [Deltaproteobacteria bacterium]|nr:GMC family oxidoreductase [Deltaproteobacteria bacterium]